MKKNIVKLYVLQLMLLLSIGFVVTSCKDDDDKIKTAPKPNQTTVSNSGEMRVINATTNETYLTNGELTINGKKVLNYAKKGDKIRMEYVPSEEYKSLHFDVFVTIGNEAEIKATDYKYEFTIPENAPEVYTISWRAKHTDDDLIIEGNGQFDLHISDKSAANEISADMTYRLTLSKDMLSFVTPEISYVDDDGKTQSRTITDDMFKENSTSFTFGEETFTLTRFSYDFNIHYTKKTAKEVSVKYHKKANVEISKESYDFDHLLYIVSGTATSANGNSVNIGISSFIGKVLTGSRDTVNKEDVGNYIDILTSTPDVATVSINEDGTISAN